jgi:hypothetical protein
MMAAKEDLDKKFAQLLKIFSSEDFIHKRKLAGEVPFFISTFKPSQLNEVEVNLKSLIKKLDNSGIQVLEINLFTVVQEILEKKGVLQKLMAKEASVPKEKFRKQFEQLLDYKTALVPHIMEQYQKVEHQMMFLTGTSLVYPYLRTHALLENLQPKATQQPTVLFFPGEYTYSPATGSNLVLFGKSSKGYYRAFDLNNYNV